MSQETSNTSGEESFAELFEQSVTKLKEGEVVKGKILSIDADHVQVYETAKTPRAMASIRSSADRV